MVAARFLGQPIVKIADEYAGKSVFVTGGTGFIGKVLIERLLYNCKDIKKIYVLIRQKKGVTLDKRLEGMFSLPIFSKLKESRPQDLNKVIPVRGDMLEHDLGVEVSDQKVLEDDVSMVFHLGASISFKDPFSSLMKVNYEGTRKVMNMSKKIKNLQAFVHFSTAFSNFTRQNIEEVMYPPLMTFEDVNELLRTGDDAKIQKTLKAPSYMLSKSITETLVDEERKNLPVIMIRPSIVVPALKDPIPGWVDTWITGPALLSDNARGLISVALGHKSVVCDMIPCDYVCNLAIVAAARGNRTKDMHIYNICTSSINPITWRDTFDMYFESAVENERWELRPRKFVLIGSPLAVCLLTVIRDVTPAFLKDFLLRIKGEKPRYIKLLKRSIFVRDSMKMVMRTSLFLKSERAQALAQTLDEDDKVRFQFDVNTINWSQYIPILCKGINKYMINKKES